MAKFLLFFVSILYTGAILYLSLINLADTPVSGFGISDKIMHAGAYFIMATLWLLSFVINYRREKFLTGFLVICFSIIVFGILIEVFQGVLTSYRDLDFFDIIANSIGVFLAGIIMWQLKRNFNKG